jgi:hypothetical protein
LSCVLDHPDRTESVNLLLSVLSFSSGTSLSPRSRRRSADDHREDSRRPCATPSSFDSTRARLGLAVQGGAPYRNPARVGTSIARFFRATSRGRPHSATLTNMQLRGLFPFRRLAVAFIVAGTRPSAGERGEAAAVWPMPNPSPPCLRAPAQRPVRGALLIADPFVPCPLGGPLGGPVGGPRGGPLGEVRHCPQICLKEPRWEPTLPAFQKAESVRDRRLPWPQGLDRSSEAIGYVEEHISTFSDLLRPSRVDMSI